MHLSQHQFQLQSRFHQDVTDFTLSSLSPDPTGLIDCEFDHDALRNGVVSILHARGVMPDGLIFRFPEDPVPTPLAIRDHFSPTAQSHQVLLTIPAFRPSGANCSEAGANGADTRFVSADRVFSDETTGQDPKPVQLAQKNFALRMDSESLEGLVALPIARVTRDGGGNFTYDPEFVPSCMRIGASSRILLVLEGLVGMLQSKADSLARERQQGGSADAEIAGFWLSHTVQSAIPPLRHHLRIQRSHPEQVFLELSRLAGALCTFSMEARAGDLPVYRHQDPESCFDEIYRHIRNHLEVVVPQNVVSIPLQPTKHNFYTGQVPDPRTFGEATWFLGVGAPVGHQDLSIKVPRVVKVCSAKHIERLVQEAYPGLGLHPESNPPSEIRPSASVQYFRMEQAPPCWPSIVETRQVGVYVPDSIPEARLTLTVLIPEANSR
ncbi:MAG: type VI secretion system baseplate subunit TssK [Gemmatimonadetes bacterium]|nr:type VI secretion system baseplate subunit TssK [Gemmatimonadota bacterium]